MHFLIGCLLAGSESFFVFLSLATGNSEIVTLKMKKKIGLENEIFLTP